MCKTLRTETSHRKTLPDFYRSISRQASEVIKPNHLLNRYFLRNQVSITQIKPMPCNQDILKAAAVEY